MANKIQFDDLFRNYDPPEGGIQGLRGKLDNQEVKKHIFLLPRTALATVLVVIALIAVFLPARILKPSDNIFIELVNKKENPAFIKYGYLKGSSEEVSIPARERSHLATKRVETLDRNIKFYLVESIQ